MARTVDPERSAARRKAITQAAATLFAERGFENTSAAEIAKAAGVSSGSVFYYFADKRAVFRSVFEQDLPASRELVRRCTAGEDPVASILTMVDELAVEAMDPIAPGLLVEILRQAGKDPELAQVIGQNTAILRAGFAELVERGIRTGAIDPALDPDETAEAIEVVIDGAFVNADPDRDPRPMLRRIVAKLLSHPCEPAGEPA
ncbi:TetR/AcrR family transcriptional regulator [Saccharopolyspora sp. NPDC050389]|uniref:TetR/AcrR family transcriptional regulator n=1 Tax=Saccharopolyspora sp. NPDC050389 TaxID=3155516 RepID=UPI0033C547C0